jgi:hypothetical protein
MNKSLETTEKDRSATKEENNIIKFYGLFWSKSHVNWNNKEMLGQPDGWLGQGRTRRNFDASSAQVNWWKQKGIYVLYNEGLIPVYAGQAGLVKRQKSQDGVEGSSIGERLSNHNKGPFRNGWALFSWFGLLHTEKIDLRSATAEQKNKPKFEFGDKHVGLNDLLGVLEAILIEGFAPRFNARGGDLPNAVYVDQFEPKPVANGHSGMNPNDNSAISEQSSSEAF